MESSNDAQPRTPHQAVRAECRWCLGIAKGASGYDCLNAPCPLYASQLWRGRQLPKRMQPPNGTPPEEVERTRRLLREVPRRRATRKMVRLKCRSCLPERVGQPHCAIADCRLYPLTPFQPGGQPKQPRSVKQQAAAKAQGLANLRSGSVRSGPRT